MNEIQMKREAMKQEHEEWAALVVATAMIVAGSLVVLLGLVWYFI